VLPDVSGEKGADRDHLEPALARRVEREADQRRADALAFVARRHFGVGEHDLAAEQIVFRDRNAAVAEVGLEAMLLGIVADRVGR
jgi:RecA-family ATPase